MLEEFAESSAQIARRWSKLWRRLDDCTEEQLTYRPPGGGWSQLGIVEHLILVERGILRGAKETLRPLGKSRTTGLSSEVRLRGMLAVLAADFRIKAPIRQIIPHETQTYQELRVWQAETVAQWAGFLERIDEERRSVAIFRHPIGGWLNTAQTLRFIAGHFDHHLLQFRRVRTAEGYPA